MSISNIAVELLKYIEQGDIKKAGLLLNENFQFSGPVPDPIGKEDWLNLHESFAQAFPNWKFNYMDVRGFSNTVYVRTAPSGKHTGILNLPKFGLKNIQPSNKNFQLPMEDCQIKIENNRVISFHIDTGDHSGLKSIMNQIGIELPEQVK